MGIASLGCFQVSKGSDAPHLSQVVDIKVLQTHRCKKVAILVTQSALLLD